MEDIFGKDNNELSEEYMKKIEDMTENITLHVSGFKELVSIPFKPLIYPTLATLSQTLFKVSLNLSDRLMNSILSIKTTNLDTIRRGKVEAELSTEDMALSNIARLRPLNMF